MVQRLPNPAAGDSSRGGRLGTTTVARARADGYPLLLASSGPLAIAPALNPRASAYHSVRDFAGVAELASTPQVVAVSDQSSTASFAALVKQAKSKDMSYGSAGNGSLQHANVSGD